MLIRLKARSAEEAKREKVHVEQRMKTMLALKRDISANRVSEIVLYLTWVAF